MNCPLCIDAVLDERHSHGIEVDVCPNCNGVWLNHGELEKLAAKSTAPLKPYRPLGEPSWSEDGDAPVDDARVSGQEQPRAEWKSDRRQFDRDDHDDDDDDDDEKHEKKRKSKVASFGEMIEEIFDDVLDLDDLFDF